MNTAFLSSATFNSTVQTNCFVAGMPERAMIYSDYVWGDGIAYKRKWHQRHHIVATFTRRETQDTHPLLIRLKMSHTPWIYFSLIARFTVTLVWCFHFYLTFPSIILVYFDGCSSTFVRL